MLTAGLSAAGALGLASPAFADTATWTIDYHTSSGLVANGSATVIRSGNSVEVKITLNPGSTFDGTVNPNLQICASTTAFATKVDGQSGCISNPNGEFFVYNENSSSTADETFTLGAPFTNTAGYLQIHLNTLDNGAHNTSMVNPPNGNVPIYGNVPTDPLPITAIGAVGLAGTLGGVLFLMQRRRRQSKATV